MARPSTLAEAADRIVAGELQVKALGEFLDAFYGALAEQTRRDMLAEVPVVTGDKRLDALLGAMCEYLSKQHGLGSVPGWAGEPVRVLDEPWFTGADQSDGMREFLTFSSPAEFVHHNIFCEAVPLRRASQRRGQS